MVYDIIVGGGGAAGFFAAIELASQQPGIKILILEKTTKLLSKVRISGGGRCNVTHHCFEPTPLSKHYPRGQKDLKQLFRNFQAADTVAWFQQRDVELITEEDGRMFPVTEKSETIIDCFLREAKKFKIEILLESEINQVKVSEGSFNVQCRNGKHYNGRKFIVAIGGQPKAEFYSWIAALGHTIIDPIPSLFTFNDPEKTFTDLMGVSVPSAEVKIAGTKFSSEGPVLITHWGLSGPAVIRLSAWAARHLHDVRYEFTILINWTSAESEESVRSVFKEMIHLHGSRRITSHPLFEIPHRLWERLCQKAEISDTAVWAETQAKRLNRLIEFSIRCPFQIKGKTTFKEEFVTCGGIALAEINISTMESRKIPGLYFAGEVIDVDGETGGFNFQSAWTTAYVAATSISELSKKLKTE